MRRLVSSSAALAADRAAEQNFGYPPWMLMEEAGIRLQDRLELLEASGAWRPGRVVYLAGPGNNGGDVWVMARQAFLRGRPVAVVPAVRPSSSSCLQQAAWAEAVGVPVAPWPSEEAEVLLKSAPVWVDGLWGTGLRGPLRPEAAALIAELETLRSREGKPVAAIDTASGLREGRRPSDPVLRARWTLTPGPLKDFCFHPANREASGDLIEVPLAFPHPASPAAWLLEGDDLASLVPPVSPHAHKGRRGHVAVAGGGPGMTGAVVLAARSAAAAGAGLVSLGTDPELIPLVAPQVPAFQVRPADELPELGSRYDAWVAGPGWGRSGDRVSLLERLWASDLPLVLDADGLAVWAALGRPARRAPTILTPHPGEFVRLGAGSEASVEAAAFLAAEKNLVVVLKGSTTWIAAPDGQKSVWDGVEPALGTGGSGDCLAGVAGAMLAVGLGAYEAARAAVVLHGEAGRSLARQEGWFTADRLPDTLARIALACRTGGGRL